MSSPSIQDDAAEPLVPADAVAPPAWLTGDALLKWHNIVPQLVAAGAVELTLLGQNVNAYHGEAADGSSWGLARLIRAVAEIEGVARIRYTT